MAKFRCAPCRKCSAMKTPVFLLALIGIAVACSSTNNKNVELSKAMFDAFNRHDWKGMADYYESSAEFLDPSYGEEYVTRSQDQTATKYAEMQSAFPDIHDDVRGIYSDGDKVIVEFVSTGSSGDSIKFSLPIISVLTFKEGKIVRDATYYDQ